MIARAARILDLPEPELPLPPLRATARMSRPAAAAQAVAAMRDFMARPGASRNGFFHPLVPDFLPLRKRRRNSHFPSVLLYVLPPSARLRTLDWTLVF